MDKIFPVGKMLDGSCAIHKMRGIYSEPVQPPGTFCPLIAKRHLLGFKCTTCSLEEYIPNLDLDAIRAGQKRYYLLHKVIYPHS